MNSWTSTELSGEGVQLAGNLAQLAERFLDAVHSMATVATYRCHRSSASSPESPVTPAALVAYRARLVRDGCGVATHKQALSAVHGFLAWAADLAQVLLRVADLAWSTSGAGARPSRSECPAAPVAS